MSATEAAATPAVAVEEVKPSEAPVTDTSAPAPEVPKVEAAAAPVRLFLCVTIHCSIFYFLYSKEAAKTEAAQVGHHSSL